MLCHLAGIRDQEQLFHGPLSGALFENYCIQETVKCFANLGQASRLSYMRTNNGLEVDLIIEVPGLRPLPVEIKLSRTPSASMASGLARFSALFSRTSPEDGLLLCLADGERPLCRGVTTVGVEVYLERVKAWVLA